MPERGEREARGERAGRAHRHLLAQNGAHREFERIECAWQSQPGTIRADT
mgnify:CR=1 FL=1